MYTSPTGFCALPPPDPVMPVISQGNIGTGRQQRAASVA